MAKLKHSLASEMPSTEVTLTTDFDLATTSIPKLVTGVVTDVLAVYDAINSNTGVLSTHFTFNYKLSSDAAWTTGKTFAEFRTALLNPTDSARRMYISATNTVSLVPAAVVLTIKR